MPEPAAEVELQQQEVQIEGRGVEAPEALNVEVQEQAPERPVKVLEEQGVDAWIDKYATSEYLDGDWLIETNLGTQQSIEAYKACLVFRPTKRERYGVLLTPYLGIASLSDALNFKLGSPSESFAYFPLGLPRADAPLLVHSQLANMMMSHIWSS